MPDEVQQDEQVDDRKVDPFEIFSPEIRDKVRGLVLLGYIEGSTTFCGHTFTLQTLRPGYKAAISLIIQPWRNTLAEPEVYANAHVGLALTSVDGDSMFCPPPGPDPELHARGRLNYVTHPDTGWYQPTLDYLYTYYLSLESEQIQAIEELQNLSSGSQQPSQPSAASSTVPGISPELMHMASQLSQSSN